jgi:hypothetical protein
MSIKESRGPPMRAHSVRFARAEESNVNDFSLPLHCQLSAVHRSNVSGGGGVIGTFRVAMGLFSDDSRETPRPNVTTEGFGLSHFHGLRSYTRDGFIHTGNWDL